MIDKKKLYSFAFSDKTGTYSLTPELITSINWDTCTAAMGNLPFGKSDGWSSTLMDGMTSDDDN